jgi:Protein of unknown function (DUF1360)
MVGLRRLYSGYSPQPRPFAEYGGLITLFNVGYAGLALVAARSRRLPERYSMLDVALAGVATHKLSRLITKDKVTSAIRAPFTSFEGSAPQGEVDEKARGEGAQKAVGELLVCPYCVGLWIAATLTMGLVYAPRATRLVSFTFSALALSDVLQVAYRAAGDAAQS